MRALCGSIITAGALIGLGLLAQAIGTRYQHVGQGGAVVQLTFGQLDKSLELILVLLVSMVFVGLGISFLGLAYHHQRRHREFLRDHATTHHPVVPPRATV